ncbi:MAG: DUF616 domain-containing protein [Clostridia bacterium]|nr:DUF616 domain-containing protein [Clostridia bacterium]
MNEVDYIKKIEELNLENINLKNSREYVAGKKIIRMRDSIKKLKIITLVKKMIENKRISKYNAHGQLDNDYKVNVSTKQELPKIAVYTCITGNYDKEILEPFLKTSNIDYFLYTDNTQNKSVNWKIKELPSNVSKYNNILKNRYIKMHPQELFSKYDYSIYIDGNVKVMSDLTDLVYSLNEKTGVSMHRHQFRNCIYNEIEVCKIKKKGNYKKLKEQVERYKKEGFPKNFGMLEATIIVTDLKNKNAKLILDNWWKEFTSSESLRDQIALQYVIWKNNFKIEDFGNLGNNLYRNPKFRVNIH